MVERITKVVRISEETYSELVKAKRVDTESFDSIIRFLLERKKEMSNKNAI